MPLSHRKTGPIFLRYEMKCVSSMELRTKHICFAPRNRRLLGNPISSFSFFKVRRNKQFQPRCFLPGQKPNSPESILWPLALAATAATTAFTPKGLPLKVLSGPSNLNTEVLRNIELLTEPYMFFPILSNPHVETIFAALFRSRPQVNFRRECLRMSDNGSVALDWPVGGSNEELWNVMPAPNAPVLILLPGLTGGSGDSYVRHHLIQARQHGWHTVVFNSRGCADSPVTTPKFYSASFTQDLREVVKHVVNRFPCSHVYATGWSLGANILLRYIGQEAEKCPLSAAVSLCNPFDLVIADEDFHKGFNNIYDKSLAKNLRNIFKKHASLFEGIGGEYNIHKAANATSVRDFDDGITRVSFGYDTVDDYYYDASSSHSVKDVKIPLLCVQAEDDPIAPSRGIPYAAIKANPNCILVVTPKGGHLGWVSGNASPFEGPWTEAIVLPFLHTVERILDGGSQGSGLNENTDKSEAIHIGSKDNPRRSKIDQILQN